MTKRVLIVRLARDPIAIQRASARSSFRVAPHDDPDPRSGGGRARPVPGAPLIEEHPKVYARENAP